MDFLINDGELAALCGLSHIHQLAYLRGVRPYMDVKTGLVGIKRWISYQSIAEQLYVEPHQGIKAQRFSRDQMRRAIAGLARSGAITVQSEGMQLILKCELATMGYSVQNKATINPPQKAITNPPERTLVHTGLSEVESSKADTGEMAKTATPLKEKNYIFLLSQFEKFWVSYPEKKSRENAWNVFQQLNPDQALFNQMLEALNAQIKHREEKQLQGNWVPPWKYPANWLLNQCWNDELTMGQQEVSQHAKCRKNTGDESAKDMFWIPDESVDEPTDEQPKNNVIPFQRCK